MHGNHSKFLFKLMAAIAAFSLLISGFGISVGPPAHALGLLAATQGIQPLAANGDSFHYYASGQRIDLTPSMKWVSVKFADANPGAQVEALKGSGAPLNSAGSTGTIPGNGWSLVPVTPGTTQEALVKSINAMRAMPARFTGVNPVFQAGPDQMAVTDEFIAAFDPGESQTQIDATNANYGVEIVQPLFGQANTFVLRVTADSHVDALAMSNLYQDSGAAVSAAPNFLRMTPLSGTAPSSTTAPGTAAAPSFTPPPNDPFYTDQWSLNNTEQYSGMTPGVDIGAPAAWAVTTGSSTVVIAVVDSGVELTQEDLSAAGKLVPGCDETATVVGPCVTANGTHGGPCIAPCPNNDDARGTAMAGLAAASTNNSTGIAGVCPDCKIMPVRIGFSNSSGWQTTDAWAAAGIAWASTNGASIIVSGWQWATPSTAVNTAIANATCTGAGCGRGGLGTVVVFAAGDNNSSVAYPANLNSVISVGALNMCNAREQPSGTFCDGGPQAASTSGSLWGSNFGPQLDLVAPGVALDITDRMGTVGYNNGCSIPPGNYNICFSGTAGAAAIVAGVAGLLVSAKSGLNAAVVKTILESSAVDVPPEGFDNDTGFGVVNANNAVRAGTNVYIGGNFQGSYYVPSQRSKLERYNSLSSGPVEVTNLNPLNPLVASERVLLINGAAGSYTELMGVPSNQLDTTYWMPWYNNLDLATQLRFGNVSSTTATVNVYIGGNLMTPTPITLLPGASTRVAYTGVSNGPVKIVSDQQIVAAERLLYAVNGVTTSYSEMMGLPNSKLDTTYWMPWYNNVDLSTQLRFGNVSGLAATVTVSIGGSPIGTPFTLQPGESTRVAYTGVSNGPVKIVSTQPIVAAERVLFASGGAGSFTELMGLPNSQLDSTYWMPWYDNVNLATQLRFGNVSGTTATVNVYIGGNLMTPTPITLLSGQSTRVAYAVNNGPVKIVSTQPIVAAERLLYAINGVTTSFSEMMGMPNGQMNSAYWMPWYNNVDMNTQLRFALP